MIEKILSMVEKFLHRAGDHADGWRRRDRARQAEAEADRDELWAEAKERERLLAETMGEEEARRAPAGEAMGRHRFVFAVHTEEASEALASLAGEGYRLVNAVPGGGSTSAGVKGSWLVFERPGKSSCRRLRSSGSSAGSSVRPRGPEAMGSQTDTHRRGGSSAR
jgi:hypothetical protein